jgi:hypothetical protein
MAFYQATAAVTGQVPVNAGDVLGGKPVSGLRAVRGIQVLHTMPISDIGGAGGETLDAVLQDSLAPAWLANQNLYDGTNDGSELLRDGAASNLGLAIPFTPAISCTIYSVHLRLSRLGTPAKAAGGTPPCVHVSITPEAAGAPVYVPGGAATQVGLGSSRGVETADIATAIAEYEFLFETGVDLTAGTPYWIVIDGDYDTSAVNAIRVHYDTAVSACAFYDAAWANLAAKNIWYRMKYCVFSNVTLANIEGGAFDQFTEQEAVNIMDWWNRRELTMGEFRDTVRVKYTAGAGASVWLPYTFITISEPLVEPLTDVNT